MGEILVDKPPCGILPGHSQRTPLPSRIPFVSSYGGPAALYASKKSKTGACPRKDVYTVREKPPYHEDIFRREVNAMSSVAGYGGYTSTGAILVLFILLVIVSRHFFI
jgi:hypothetical protein